MDNRQLSCLFQKNSMTKTYTDIGLRKVEIQRLVGSDHIPKAIKRLMDFSTDFSNGREHFTSIVSISNALQQLESQHAQSLIDKNDFEEKRTALAKSILELSDLIEEQNT